MFYLNGRVSGDGGTARIDRSPSNKEDEFGWFIGGLECPTNMTIHCKTKDCRSSSSSASMLSCIDSEETDAYTFSSDYSKNPDDEDYLDNNDEVTENIELNTITRNPIDEEFDNDLIDGTTTTTKTLRTIQTKYHDNPHDELAAGEPILHKTRGICYTPERLVRCEEYRILIPSPRFLSISRINSENDNPRKARLSKKRLNYLIDSKQIGEPRLIAFLESYNKNVDNTEIEVTRTSSPDPVVNTTSILQDDAVLKRTTTTTITTTTTTTTTTTMTKMMTTTQPIEASKTSTTNTISNRSSYERLSVTWDDLKKQQTTGTTRRSSVEDTSGIQSNDWSSETQSDTQTNPLYICDELGNTASSGVCSTDFVQVRSTAISEVVSILQELESNPEKARILLDDDRFRDKTSAHDNLTRLALTIETDGNVPPVLGEPDKSVCYLRKRVERLQDASKDIFKDICELRKDFEYEEEKLLDLSSDALRLRQDLHEVKCIDDLLRLLRGELERISNRNWPFVLGHAEQQEEMNLVV